MQNDNKPGQLSGRFEGFTAEPSVDLWSVISANLDENKKRRTAIWWWLGSGMAAMIVISIVILNQPITEIQKIQLSQLSKGESKWHPKKDVTKAESNGLLANQYAVDANQSKTIKTINEDISQTSRNEIIVADSDKNAIEEIVNKSEKNSAIVLKVNIDPLAQNTLNSFIEPVPIEELVILEQRNLAAKKWEFGIGYSGWWTSKNEFELEPDPNEFVTDTSGGVSADNLTKLSLHEVGQRPIGLNIHVGYELSHRLKLITGFNFEGLRYTKLSNDPNYNSSAAEELLPPNEYINIHQLYLGIPIGINYNFIQQRRWRIGVGVAVLQELPFYQVVQPLNALGEPISEKPYLSVLQGYSLGLQSNLTFGFDLNEKLSLKFTPGMRWYAIQRTNSAYQPKSNKTWLGGQFNLVWEL